MANTKIRLTTRNKMAQIIVDDLDAVPGPSTIDFYTAPQPAGPDTAVTDQILLGTVTCSNPSAVVDAGVIVFEAITQDDVADNDGTAVWCRHRDSVGDAVNDYDVTVSGGGGAVTMTNPVVVAGGPLRMDSLTITIGGA